MSECEFSALLFYHKNKPIASYFNAILSIFLKFLDFFGENDGYSDASRHSDALPLSF